MEAARNVTEDISILPSYFPIPGFGLVPVNAFVVKARQPMLVDSGLPQEGDAFLEALQSVIDHADHVGSLKTLLTMVPDLKVITTFLSFGILSLQEPFPPDRVYLLNPGQALDLGDRTITAYKPPTFDNPATTGFYDSRSRALFSSDCFGGLLQSPSEMADEMNPEDLRAGQSLWTKIDSPWLHKVDQTKFARELDVVRQMEPSY